MAADEKTTLRVDFVKTGYSQEEEYFHKHNRELIDRKRRELDASRIATREKQQEALHWMRCPKCGSQMEETLISGIYVDRCTRCHGIYLDQGELTTLIEAEESHHFLRAVGAAIRRRLGKADTSWRP